MSDTGTTTAGMTVWRTLRRKTKTTRITRPIEISIVIWTSWTEARMVVVRSESTDSVIAGGIDAWSVGSSARIPSTAAMMLAPGSRDTMISTAGLPFAYPPVRMSSTESTTSPTS